MRLNTASEVISFTRKLEEDSAKFYEDLAQADIKGGETLLSLAQENRKNIIQIERAYYGVITDALEGCFAFNINLDEYDDEGRAIGGKVVAVGAENGYTVNIIFQPDGSKVGEVYRDGELVGVMNMSVDAEQFENYVDVETEQTVQMPTGSMYYK